MKKIVLAMALVAASTAFAQPVDNGYHDYRGNRDRGDMSYWRNRPNQPTPMIAPVVVDRHIERDNRGRRFIVTTTQTCVNARWNWEHRPVCLAWRTDVTRERVRRGRNRFDLNGDGRTDPWERLLYRGFQDVLDNR
jgi:hypothetical protein